MLHRSTHRRSNTLHYDKITALVWVSPLLILNIVKELLSLLVCSSITITNATNDKSNRVTRGNYATQLFFTLLCNKTAMLLKINIHFLKITEFSWKTFWRWGDKYYPINLAHKVNNITLIGLAYEKVAIIWLTSRAKCQIGPLFYTFYLLKKENKKI